eukprot:8659733-Alexandrium_andersonii.AAC.1
MPTVAERAPGSGEPQGARLGRRPQGQVAAAVRQRSRHTGSNRKPTSPMPTVANPGTGGATEARPQ